MKPYFLLISHGDFAKELLRSGEMIVGPIDEAKALSMNAEEGKEGLLKKVREALEALPPERPLLIAVDILSGTPCNVAVEVMAARNRTAVVAGLNLGMVLEFWASQEESPDLLAERITSASREVVRKVEKPSLKSSEEGYED